MTLEEKSNFFIEQHQKELEPYKYVAEKDKISNQQEDFLIYLGQKFNTNIFNIEDAKKYIINEKKFSEDEFTYFWGKSFEPCHLQKEKSYIWKTNNEKYHLTYSALRLIPKKEKNPWTHAEIISIISVITASIASVSAAIANIINLIK